jgi:CelD/BcsL family acetyltransferase involved in cellulose biosynthesis
MMDTSVNNRVDTSSSNKKRNTLSISIISNIHDFQSLQEEWQALAKTADSFIYQTFEWNWIWWKHLGKDKKLHIIILHEKERLVGIIPLFWDTISFLNQPLYSCLRFIGSNVSQPHGETLMGLQPYSTYLDVIIRPNYQEKVIDKLITYFSQAELPFNEIILDEVPENSCLWKYLLPALRKKQCIYSVEESSICPVVELSGTWEEYQQNLSKKNRYRNRKALRQIDEDDEKGFHISEPKDINEFNKSFDLLVKLHQERWNKRGFPGTFAETQMYNLFKEATKTFYKKGWGQIRMAKPVKSPENVIAMDLLFDYQDRIYLVHRAMDFSSPFCKGGPGNVLLSFTIKKTVDDGGKGVFDLLRGAQPYKLRLANATTTNHCITIRNPLKHSEASVKLAHQYTTISKRAKVEWAQFNLFMQGKTQQKGLRGYLKFLSERIEAKIGGNAKK